MTIFIEKEVFWLIIIFTESNDGSGLLAMLGMAVLGGLCCVLGWRNLFTDEYAHIAVIVVIGSITYVIVNALAAIFASENWVETATTIITLISCGIPVIATFVVEELSFFMCIFAVFAILSMATIPVLISTIINWIIVRKVRRI